MDLTEELRAADKALRSARGDELRHQLRDHLRKVIGWPYEIDEGVVADEHGSTSAFPIVVYAPFDAAKVQDGRIPSDNTGAVVEVVEELDLETFEACYRRVAVAKGLAKAPPPKVGGVAITNTTMGAILAKRTTVALEAIAARLEQLNAETPHDQWTDMIAVLGVGVINYGIQFPGEGIVGDHLPPAKGATADRSPPWYVVIVVRPVPEFAFNKLVAFLLVQLRFFTPDAKLPNYQDALVGMSDNAITHGGFQYNLSGQLVPVLREHYNDRYIPPRPLRIVDRKGRLLATILRLPWQDGAVIMLQGKAVPLEGLLVFFEPRARPTVTTFRRDNEVQLSCVLPMSAAQFSQGLQRFQQQSNMRVRPPDGHVIIQRMMDEGTNSPFVARLMLGTLRLRDAVYSDPKARERFDVLFEQITAALLSARDAATEVHEIWAAHEQKIKSGQIVSREGSTIHIRENMIATFGAARRRS